VAVKQLKLPAGKLKILSVAPNVFGWGPEVFVKSRP
jgi:hypothetical protein